MAAMACNASTVAHARAAVESGVVAYKQVICRRTPCGAPAKSSSLRCSQSTFTARNSRLCCSTQNQVARTNSRVITQASGNPKVGPSRRVRGPCFVVDDNIDTDQIIPAEYLTLVPSKPDEYERLGSHAMCGLPARYGKFVEEGEMKTQYPIMIGGDNFGCGSSREHAPVAMGAAGCAIVVAQSYARIFFRNCVATGELYPYEVTIRLCDEFKTGQDVEVDLNRDVIVNHTTGKEYQLSPLGEAGPVIDAGGIFNYARQTGMIAARS